MLTEDQFADWCRALALPVPTVQAIRNIRSAPPARLVGNGRNNVSGRYPSRKMGVTIQFESHRNELAAIYAMEHDQAVLEYWDQPPPIKLNYQTAAGRALGVLHTPDFFVLRRTGAGWEEWKLEADLLHLAASQPHRYQRTAAGDWACPPGEAYAKPAGLSYRLRSSATIQWVLQRNLIFLEDYLRTPWPVEEAVRRQVRQWVSAQPGLTLQALLQQAETAKLTADVIYSLIATEQLSVALDQTPLAEPARVAVYADAETMAAYAHVAATTAAPFTPGVEWVCGGVLVWEENRWTILNVGVENLSLRGDDQTFTELPRTIAERLLQQGKLTGTTPTTDAAQEKVRSLLAQAGPAALQEANRRYEMLRPWLDKEMTGRPTRTIYRWRAAYERAQQLYGNGYVGLLPHKDERGNRGDKLPAASRALLAQCIERDYESCRQKNKQSVYATLLHECATAGTLAPSYKTFCRAVAARPRVEQTRRRQGARAAYRHEPFYFELQLTTPRHGDRPFEIVHLDHTELDVELVCSQTGRNLGRPWASFLTDAFSRRLLAVVLLYQAPSKVACMLVVRECVRRFGRLPQTLVVDGGREFQSTYFETLLAYYECVKKTRPPAKARFGSVCERLFGTANTQFVHNLQGNTQIMRNVRQATAAVNPRAHACWTLEALAARLREFAYEVYDTAPHAALGQSPREIFLQGLATSGARAQRLIANDETFRMLTMPSTYQETATVAPGKGIRLNYLYYWAEALRDPLVEQTRVPVRYDPHDAGVAYAFVKRQWVQCVSEHYPVFHGRSAEEVRLAAAELHQRRRKTAQEASLTARRLAQFLQSIEAEEVLLTQRLRDAAVNRSLRSATALTTAAAQAEATEVVVVPDQVRTTETPAAFQWLPEY